MKPPRKNYSDIISTFALVVAATALLQSWTESKRSDREDITFRSHPHSDQLPIKLTGGKYKNTRVIQFPFLINATNTGNRSASIIAYDMIYGPDDPSNRVMIRLGESIDGGLSAPSGKPFPLPVYLQPGESIEFAINLGILIRDDHYNEIEETLKTPFNRVQLNEFLGKNGIRLHDFNERGFYNDYPLITVSFLSGSGQVYRSVIKGDTGLGFSSYFETEI